MRIGLTYDLRDDYLKEGYSDEATAEFDRVDTIDAIESALQQQEFETDRIGNVKHLVKRLASGHKWDMVFNIAEGMFGIGREALVPALLDAYNIPYTFSDPLVLAFTLHKGLTKSIVRNAGIPTADFFVVEKISDIEKVSLPFPLFAKPIAEGTGKGINHLSRIDSKEKLKLACSYMLEKFKQPVLVETFLPGREFTIGVVGTGDDASVVGAMEVIFKSTDEIYSYSNKANYEKMIEYKIPEDAIMENCKKLALDVWRVLNCRDGGRIDVRMDGKGVLNFIEVNPLAGLNPVHSDLPIICRLNGISFQDLIKKIMKSAQKRISGA
jgi:D-alanine-D-alanine ligase